MTGNMSISMHLCKIYEMMISYRAASHWIIKYYLSIEEDLKLSLAVVMSLMVAGIWQGCLSLAPLLFHPRSSTSATSPSWWPDGSRNHNYTVRHNHVNRAALGERQQRHLLFPLVLTRTRVSVMFAEWATLCMRDLSWERGCPGLAYQWPQWQMCCLIPGLAAALAGVNINWLSVSCREDALPM